MQTIGVLGGIGPVATAYFFECLLAESCLQLKSIQDEEYPHIIINSLSLRTSTEHGIADTEEIFHQLAEGIKSLANAGVDFITIPCNSSHSMLESLRLISPVPIIDIITTTLEEVSRNKSRKSLLLASGEAYKENLWRVASSKDIEIIEPKESEKKIITDIILAVMGNNLNSPCKIPFLHFVNEAIVNYHTDSVILGCTELPVIIKQPDLSVKLFDSSRILAKEAIKRCQTSNNSRT